LKSCSLRYPSSAPGRDPQSWNRDTYAADDPSNHTDPSGLDYCVRFAERQIEFCFRCFPIFPEQCLVAKLDVFVQGSGLHETSVALLEQIRAVDRARLVKQIGRLDPKAIAQLDEAVAITLGLKRF